MRSADEPIVLTRSAEDCLSWAASLRDRGIESITLPCIETRMIGSTALRDSLAATLREADWLLLTSQRGAEAVAGLVELPLPEQLRVAAVGAATAHSARELLGRADFTAEESTAAGMAGEFAAHLEETNASCVLALAANAGNVLADTLRAAGHRCQRFDVYRTIPVAAQPRRRTLAEIGSRTVFLASPSAVEGFVNQVDVDGEARLVSIGPSTSAAIRHAGMEVYAQAQTPGLNGMLAALEE